MQCSKCGHKFDDLYYTPEKELRCETCFKKDYAFCGSCSKPFVYSMLIKNNEVCSEAGKFHCHDCISGKNKYDPKPEK